MEYTCTKFGVDSSSRFPVRARTSKQTHIQTRLNALPTPAAMPAWVIIALCSAVWHGDADNLLQGTQSSQLYSSLVSSCSKTKAAARNCILKRLQ